MFSFIYMVEVVEKQFTIQGSEVVVCAESQITLKHWLSDNTLLAFMVNCLHNYWPHQKRSFVAIHYSDEQVHLGTTTLL